MTFDQCGLLVYVDSDNWIKAGLEYENESYSRLGSKGCCKQERDVLPSAPEGA